MGKYISLVEETAKKINDMIFEEKKFLPGSKLPNEQVLAEMLSVSRTSIREAVKILIANHILTIHRGVGTFVNETLSKNYDPFSISCSRGRKKDVLDALNIRLCLEGEMAKSIIDNATKDDIEEIIFYESNCRNCISSNTDYTIYDQLFHESLAKSTHNLIYKQIIIKLHSSIIIMQHSAKYADKTWDFSQNALELHRTIVDSILKKDCLGATLAFKTHVYNSIKIVSAIDNINKDDTLKKQSVSEVVIDKLTRLILIEKKYSPGSKIPDEQAMAEMFSISRTSVREAVKVLVAQGTLEIHRGVGTFVTDNPYAQNDPLGPLYPNQLWQYAMDALKIRLILEPKMSSNAALVATEDDIAKIKYYEEECRNLIVAKKDYAFVDRAFHKAVATACHNDIYEELLPMLHTSITIILQSIDYTKTSPKSAENSLKYHKMLADCIASRDSIGAEIATQTHIYNAICYLNEYR